MSFEWLRKENNSTEYNVCSNLWNKGVVMACLKTSVVSEAVRNFILDNYNQKGTIIVCIATGLNYMPMEIVIFQVN